MSEPGTRAPENADGLAEGEVARIGAIASDRAGLELKLREIGFCEGDEIELLKRGPIGGQPLAFRLNRRILALRREEANALLIAAGDRA